MPGRRNHAKERAAHEASKAARQSALYLMLRTQLPDHDVALVGWPAILAYLHSLGVTRPNAQPLNRTIVHRWRRRAAFPLLPGNYHARVKAPPVTTMHAVTAWLLSCFTSADRLFAIGYPAAFTAPRNFTACPACKRAA